MAPQGSLDGSSVSSALGTRISPDKSCALHGPAWHPEHLNDLYLLGHCVEFPSLQLVVQVRHFGSNAPILG